MKFTYLLVNIFSALVPFIFSFHPKIKFNKHFLPFIKANVIASIIFLIWDVIFTSINVWSFNDNYTIGLKILNLPLEEIMFFFFIPFACVFTYHCSWIFFKAQWNKKIENIFVISFSILIFTIGILSIGRLYTTFTFVSAALFLIALRFYFKVQWLPQFFSIYPVLLIPFFVVNGILTGTGLEQPVVIYNDSENLGIRIFTIPVEDVIYGLELLLLNIFLFERLQDRTQNREVKGNH